MHTAHARRLVLALVLAAAGTAATGCGSTDAGDAPVTDDQINAKETYERAKAIATAYLDARRNRPLEREALPEAKLVGRAAADFAALGKPCSKTGYPRFPSAVRWKPSKPLSSLPEGAAYAIEVYTGGAVKSLDFVLVYDLAGALLANIQNQYSVADTTTTLVVCP